MSYPISEKLVTAIKRHRCRTCNRPAVEPGQRYLKTTLVHDGRIYNWTQCVLCQEAFEWVWDYMGDEYTLQEGIGPEDYVEWADEMSRIGEGEELAAALAYLERID